MNLAFVRNQTIVDDFHQSKGRGQRRPGIVGGAQMLSHGVEQGSSVSDLLVLIRACRMRRRLARERRAEVAGSGPRQS